MNFRFTRDFSTETQNLERVFEKDLHPWWDDIQVYLRAVENDHTWNVLPPFVLSVYYRLGLNRDYSAAITNIFKMIYLATFIHESVGDESEGQEYDRNLQFSILIGDYIFGKILECLVKADADMLVPAFANMICELNEGLVYKHKLDVNYEEVIKKTRGPLYRTAYLTAAISAGKNVQEQEILKMMGFNLGVAVELINSRTLDRRTLEYLTASASFRALYGFSSSGINNVIEDIYNELTSILSKRNKLAAV